MWKWVTGLSVVVGLLASVVVMTREPRDVRLLRAEWTERYGERVVTALEESLKARGWKRGEIARHGQDAKLLRLVQDDGYGQDGGVLNIWSAEDGDEVSTIEGTVEFTYPSGRSFIANIQLYTPDGDNSQAFVMWADAYHVEAGDPNSPAEASHRPFPNGGMSLMEIQSTNVCQPGMFTIKGEVLDCMRDNAGELFREGWVGAAAGVIGGLPACTGNLVARAGCLARASAGGFMAGVFIRMMSPNPWRDCRWSVKYKEWCDNNGYNFTCESNTVWQNPWCR